MYTCTHFIGIIEAISSIISKKKGPSFTPLLMDEPGACVHTENYICHDYC